MKRIVKLGAQLVPMLMPEMFSRNSKAFFVKKKCNSLNNTHVFGSLGCLCLVLLFCIEYPFQFCCFILSMYGLICIALSIPGILTSVYSCVTISTSPGFIADNLADKED